MFTRRSRLAAGAAATAAALAMLVAPAAAAQPPSTLEDLIDATARRLEVAEPVALAKFHSGQPVKDPQREQQVIDAVSAEASLLGADPAVVTAVFRDQIDASVGIQYARLSQWTLDPASAPAAAEDLAAARAVLDEVNRQMVSEIAEQRAVLQSPVCPAELDQAKAVVADARGFDPLYRQALDVATRSYCR
ncbi:chorismate mutase [Mycobacterium sp. SMC-4]|uniref:chorismate mutase n=1 Tax=Mycobacterium sp. SMC-4 TaxID=2857059 RepID=UPI0021B220A6|nr:chorismate mutase [Mycobacterium sp. SMC-4]UXA17381.1 chorismate mutase [Mycobacterium sp. SMC-4]